jgi:hypothetical protein
MAEQATKDRGISPPYVPFDTLKGFIETLSKTAVPPRVDRSIMPTLSGGAQNQLISALKFLKLIGSSGEVSEPLRSLVKTFGTDQWRTELSDVISAAYGDITNGLDLDTASSKQLVDHFRDRGKVDGQMLDKSVRFYIKALKESEVTYSPHFNTRQSNSARRSPTPRATKAKTQAPATQHGDATSTKINNHDPHTFVMALLAKFPDFDPKWDAEQQKAWFDAYGRLLAMQKDPGATGS